MSIPMDLVGLHYPTPVLNFSRKGLIWIPSSLMQKICKLSVEQYLLYISHIFATVEGRDPRLNQLVKLDVQISFQLVTFNK